MIHFKIPESKSEPKQLRTTGLDVDSAFKNRLRNAYKKTVTQPKCKEDRRVKVSKESIGDLQSQTTGDEEITKTNQDSEMEGLLDTKEMSGMETEGNQTIEQIRKKRNNKKAPDGIIDSLIIFGIMIGFIRVLPLILDTIGFS